MKIEYEYKEKDKITVVTSDLLDKLSEQKDIAGTAFELIRAMLISFYYSRNLVIRFELDVVRQFF